MEGNILHEKKAKAFVEHSMVKFKWTDLSNNVIMDVGCGMAGYCGKAILEKFPDVGAIIFSDSNPKEIQNFQLKVAANMEIVVADIEKRDTLRKYAGNMDKVISTYVFHHLVEKEEAFRNVYHLLKPGGEAAVVSVKKTLLYEWLAELFKKPKWKRAYKDQYTENAFESEFGADYYREIVEKIGFQILECKEENTVIPYPSDEECKDSLYGMSRYIFNIPSEAIEEFKEDAFQALLKVSPRDEEGKPCSRGTEVSVLLTKPKENILLECKAKAFVEHCAAEFKWTDLSSDVIMDVGCGEAGYCGKAILEKFLVVGTIVFMDNNPKEIQNFRLNVAANMKCVIADIEKRETLRNYAGKMDKVISTYVFHQLVQKEEAFRNVYHLLKPGGEAAVVLIKKSLLNVFLQELRKKPNWDKAYKKRYPEYPFECELGADYYRRMVVRMGFQVVECKEENAVITYPSDEECKESLYQMSRYYFHIPSEAIEEFKEDSFEVLLRLSGRNDEGKPCYRAREVSVLLTKPTEGCGSKPK